ncbi:MAG: lysoplasmalogenase, partial [Candidatus Dormibacteraeota bacterium]|nr:lysoplasmalogenase [Candidatus Dormibacteraeota bacterium]
MTPLAWALLGVTTALALTDWFAVVSGRKRLEYFAKPATMLALAGVAASLNLPSPGQQRWFIVALLFGALGDVFLMLPRNLFLAGLTAFLVGHLAYVAGFIAAGEDPLQILIYAAIIILPASVLLPAVVQGILAKRQRLLVPPVLLYSLVITLMVGAALGSGKPLAAAGGLLFYTSDTLIGYNRFVFQRRWLPLAIIVTYHLGQLG